MEPRAAANLNRNTLPNTMAVSAAADLKVPGIMTTRC